MPDGYAPCPCSCSSFPNDNSQLSAIVNKVPRYPCAVNTWSFQRKHPPEFRALQVSSVSSFCPPLPPAYHRGPSFQSSVIAPVGLTSVGPSVQMEGQKGYVLPSWMRASNVGQATFNQRRCENVKALPIDSFTFRELLGVLLSLSFTLTISRQLASAYLITSLATCIYINLPVRFQ